MADNDHVPVEADDAAVDDVEDDEDGVEVEVAAEDDVVADNVEEEEVEAVDDVEDIEEEVEAAAEDDVAADNVEEEAEGEEEEVEAEDEEELVEAAAASAAALAQQGWAMGAIAHTMAEYVVQALPLPAGSPLSPKYPMDTSPTRKGTGTGTTNAAAVDEAAAATWVNDGVGVALLTAASLYYNYDGGAWAATTWDALTALAAAAPGSVPTLLRDGIAIALLTATAPSTPLVVTGAALRTLAAVCISPAGAVALDGYGVMRYAANLSATLALRHSVLVAAPALHGVFCLVAELSHGLAAAGRVPAWSEVEVAAVAFTAMRTVSAAAKHGATIAAREALAALAVWPRFAGIVATASVTPDAPHRVAGGRTAMEPGSGTAPRRPQPSVALVVLPPPHPPRTKSQPVFPSANWFNDEACVARAAARVLEVCAHLGKTPSGGVPAGMLVGILKNFPRSAEVLPAAFRAVVACGDCYGDMQEATLASAVLNTLPAYGESQELANDKGTVGIYLAALSIMMQHLPPTHEMGVGLWKQLADMAEPYAHSVDTVVLVMTAMAAAAKRPWHHTDETHPVLQYVPIVAAALAACRLRDVAPLVEEAIKLVGALAADGKTKLAARRVLHPILCAVGGFGHMLSPVTVNALLTVAHAGDEMLAARVVVSLVQTHHGNKSVMQSFCNFVSTTVSAGGGAELAAAGCSTLLWDALRHHGLDSAINSLSLMAKFLPPGELTPHAACRDITAIYRSCYTASSSTSIALACAGILLAQLEAWDRGTAATLPEADAADACRALIAAAVTMPHVSDVMLRALLAADCWSRRGTAAAAPDLRSVHLWRCVTLALTSHAQNPPVLREALAAVATFHPAEWDTVPDTEAVATTYTLLLTAVRHSGMAYVSAAVAALQQLAAASPAARRHLWRVNAAVTLPALAGCMPADADDTEDTDTSTSLPPTWQAAMHRMEAGAGGDPSPALVLLSSGVVLQAAVLQWLQPADARQLRVCHPAMAAAVAEHVWDVTLRRSRVAPGGCSAWARSMPAAWTICLPEKATMADMQALGDMRRLARVCINGTASVAVTTLLPRTISTLHVSGCLVAHKLAHLTSLETLIVNRDISVNRLELPASLKHCHLLCAKWLDWERMATLPPLLTLALRRGVLPAAVAALPCSLQSLDLTATNGLRVAGVSFAHLAALHHVAVAGTGITNAVLATLPAGVLTLDVSNCQRLTPDVTFHHLGALVALRANGTSVSDETLMTGMPPSVVLLGIGCCRNVTAAATCAVLPALRQLDVSKTAVGVDMLTSLPVGLRDLDVSYCSNIDATARLSHLPNLRAISCSVTGISDTTIASCPPTLRYLRADGCRALTDALDLAHLPELAALDVTSSSIGDGMLGRLPLSLQRLELAGTKLTPAAALPPLPRLTCIIAYRTAVGATFLASLPPTVAHLNVEWCCNMRVSDAVAAWQSLVDSDTLDRLAECRVCDGDCPPRVAAMLKVRGVCFGSSSSHTCAAPFPTLLRPEWRRRVDDPFAPWIDDDVCSDDAKDAQP